MELRENRRNIFANFFLDAFSGYNRTITIYCQCNDFSLIMRALMHIVFLEEFNIFVILVRYSNEERVPAMFTALQVTISFTKAYMHLVKVKP